MHYKRSNVYELNWSPFDMDHFLSIMLGKGWRLRGEGETWFALQKGNREVSCALTTTHVVMQLFTQQQEAAE